DLHAGTHRPRWRGTGPLPGARGGACPRWEARRRRRDPGGRRAGRSGGGSDRRPARQRRVQAGDGRRVDGAGLARGRVKLEHRVTVDAPRAAVWAVLMDLPVAAACVPGTRDVSAQGDGVRGTLDVRVGPVELGLAGTVLG